MAFTFICNTGAVHEGGMGLFQAGKKSVLRRFCSKCGSPVFSEVAATPTMDWVKADTLDDPSWLEPQVNIGCDSAQPWVPMSEAIPRIPRNPPPACAVAPGA